MIEVQGSLGLTYSSSDSENAGDVRYKTEEPELATNASNSAHQDGGMNEEQRYYMHIIHVKKYYIPCSIQYARS